jgi:hypothetical protein
LLAMSGITALLSKAGARRLTAWVRCQLATQASGAACSSTPSATPALLIKAIDPLVGTLDLFCQAQGRLPIAEVSLKGLAFSAQLSDNFFGCRLVAAVVYGQGGASFAQGQGDGPADAPACAGKEDDLI